MVKTFKEYKADADKQNAELKKNDLGSIDNSADAAIKLAEDTYKKAEANTIADYASDYERNAVQKLINEKKVAETNANLGLTDSGLNRTQQTAVQLSYANQKGKLDLARQQALDKLSSDLASYVTGINNQREADKLSVNQFYDQQSNTIATELYNTDVEDARKRWETEYNAGAKAKENENNKILWYYTGTYDEDDNPVFRNSEGKTQAFGKGVNPYTNENNKKYVITNKNGNIVTKDESVFKTKGTDTQKAAAYYGVCDNGYQPKGVVINGEKQGTIKAYDAILDGNEITGKKQNVWYTKETGKYWIWYGRGNTYVEVKLVDDAWTVV